MYEGFPEKWANQLIKISGGSRTIQAGGNLQGGAPTYYLVTFFSKTVWK